MNNRSNDHIDSNGQYHGYQEWYSFRRTVYWYRGTMFHGNETGYVEYIVGDEGTEVLYYII